MRLKARLGQRLWHVRIARMVRAMDIHGWGSSWESIGDSGSSGERDYTDFRVGEVLGLVLVLLSCRTHASQLIGVSNCKVTSGTPQELTRGGSSVELSSGHLRPSRDGDEGVRSASIRGACSKLDEKYAWVSPCASLGSRYFVLLVPSVRKGKSFARSNIQFCRSSLAFA